MVVVQDQEASFNLIPIPETFCKACMSLLQNINQCYPNRASTAASAKLQDTLRHGPKGILVSKAKR